MPRHSYHRQVTVEFDHGLEVTAVSGSAPIAATIVRAPSSAAWLPVRAAELSAASATGARFTRSEHNGRRHPAETLQLVDRHLAVVQLDRRPQRVVVAEASVGNEVHGIVLAHRNSDSSDRCVLARQYRGAPMAGCNVAGLAVGFGQARTGNDER